VHLLQLGVEELKFCVRAEFTLNNAGAEHRPASERAAHSVAVSAAASLRKIETPCTDSFSIKHTFSKMVRVWYEPPPYGPRTSLNRPSYGIGGDMGPRWVVQLSKMPQGRVIAGSLVVFGILGYLPFSKYQYLCLNVYVESFMILGLCPFLSVL